MEKKKKNAKMEITMENQDKFNEIAYKKAQKRVKDIRTYYYMVLGYLAVVISLLVEIADGIFNISRNYSVWIVIFGEFSLVTEFIFHALFQKLKKETKELMEKYKQKN